MSATREAVALIPRPAWIVAVVVALGVAALLVMRLWPPSSDQMPLWARVLISTAVPLLVGALILLYGYVYADARRRGMRALLWMLLAIFIPNSIGIILYFVLRDPLLQPCLRCGTPVKTGFAHCPFCGEVLTATCPQCKAAVESGWTNCASCGSKLN